MSKDGRATPLDYALGNLGPELKEYIDGLQREIRELESRQITHLSLRLAGVTGRGTGKKPLPDHLGIAVYFIFGPPEDLIAFGLNPGQEYGMAFGLSPEKYESLMKTGSSEIVIHEAKPGNGRLKEGERFPIEFLEDNEK